MFASIPRTVAGVVVPLLLALALAGCDQKSSRRGNFTAEVAPGQVAGTWVATVTHSVTTSCGEQTSEEVFNLFIEQEGDQVTITSDVGYSAVGTIDGSRVTFTYSFPDGDGTTTSTVTLDFASLLGVDPLLLDSFSGSATYVFEGPGNSCDGTDTWTGTRMPETPPPGAGLTGSWNLTLTSETTSCTDDPQEPMVTIPVTVVQVDSDVTISIPGLVEVQGFVLDGDAQMSIFGEYQDDAAGYFVTASGLLDISDDGNTVTGPVFYIYTDVDEPADSCDGTVQWSMERIAGLP